MLCCVAHLGCGVPGHQLQYYPAGLLRLARARFTQQLDAGNLFRSFQGTQEIELGFVTGGTNDQLHLDAARVHLRPDADHAHTSGKNALQVHKNLCPGEAALFDQTVEETAAVAHLEDVRAVEELFQVPAFPAESVHPLLQLHAFRAQLTVRQASLVGVPGEPHERKDGDAADQRCARSEPPVGFQRRGGKIQTNLHLRSLTFGTAPYCNSTSTTPIHRPADQSLKLTLRQRPHGAPPRTIAVVSDEPDTRASMVARRSSSSASAASVELITTAGDMPADSTSISYSRTIRIRARPVTISTPSSRGAWRM